MKLYSPTKNVGLKRDASLTTLSQIFLLWVCAGSSPAHATTEAENDRDNATMPHESLAAHGAMVKVHLVSGRGYLLGRAPDDDAGALSRMHDQVADCVRYHNEHGLPTNPPRNWPDHINSSRTDTYSAINRTISYTSSLAYATNQSDCSLIEIKNVTAHLYSSLGTCDIDLRAKTAHGACDASGQATARAPTRKPPPPQAQITAIERDAATNPAMAALVAAMRAHPPTATGERKTILGLECELRPNPFDPDGTVCLSRGGSFASLDAAGDPNLSGMPLELRSIAGIKMLATKAKLDTPVNGAVFTPYLAAGFRITNTGARP